MSEYRILTNGTIFKIEEIVKCSFLWWKWTRYDKFYSHGPSGEVGNEIEFETIEEARDKIIDLKKRDEMYRSPWKEVASPATHEIVTKGD